MSDIALKVPGIVDSVAFPGLSIAGFSAAPNEGIVFFGLKPFEERTLARAVEVRDPRPGQRRDPADPGRAHVRRAAARGRRPRQRRRLQAPGAGPRGPRRAGAATAPSGARSARSTATRSRASARRTRPTTSTCRSCSPTSTASRAKQMGVKLRRHLRHDAGQPRLALRQRLHQVRQDLPGDRAGRRAVPRRRAGDRRAEDAQRRRRDGAARRADDGRADLRPDPRDALQRLSRRPTSTARPSPASRRARPRPRSRRC